MRYVFKWFVFQLVILVFWGVLPNFELGIFVPSFFSHKMPAIAGRFHRSFTNKTPFFLPEKWLSMLPGGDKMSFLFFFFTKRNLESNLTSIPDSKIFKHTSLWGRCFKLLTTKFSAKPKPSHLEDGLPGLVSKWLGSPPQLFQPWSEWKANWKGDNHNPFLRRRKLTNHGLFTTYLSVLGWHPPSGCFFKRILEHG